MPVVRIVFSFLPTTVREDYIFRSVCSRGRGRGAASRGGLLTGGLPNLPGTDVLTSSGGHCSGQYASYWNAFFKKKFATQF